MLAAQCIRCIGLVGCALRDVARLSFFADLILGLQSAEDYPKIWVPVRLSRFGPAVN
jgi:hypothetical protein